MKKYYLIILAICLTSCGMQPLTNTPTLTPPYIHYTPTVASNIHLEFDYPSSWIFSENRQYKDLIIIGLGDPRFLTVPTRDLEVSHGTPSNFGVINITIRPTESGQTLETLTESHRRNYSNGNWVIFLSNYDIKVNGHDATTFEYQITDQEHYTSSMFGRDVFFIIKNQVYEISFLVAVEERNNEFEKGYQYFFNSLEIIP
jgi:hypothetical protein